MRILSVLLFCALAAPLWAEPRVPESRAEISLSFAPLVREAAPAVVNIYARRVVEGRSPFAGDPFFGPLFEGLGQPQPRVQNSLGSGVILSADGLVVSNHHVVGDASDIRVVLKDGREYAAEVLLGDAEADLAILRVSGVSGMPHLPLRDSDAVEVGELVLAIGNPFGVGQTVSSGIVSGLARSGTATGNARGYFIQTDAPINPGNSGGALIDMAGRLVGVNTSILSRSGGSNGIGFAIPADLVAEFVRQARAGESTFLQPWAGLTGQAVDADLSESLGQTRPGGIAIAAIHPASPFRAAGLEVGDVILSVDGQPVNTPPEMIYRMSVAGIGREARVGIARRGETLELTVALAVAPDDPPRAAVSLGEGAALPGLELSRINPAVIEEMDLPLAAEGVVVTRPGRWGARAGLRRGDILRGVNGVGVGDPETAARALSRRGAIALELERGARRMVLRFRA